MSPDAPASRAEAAGLAAWPALREAEMDGWRLRFAGGHTSRANSVNVVGPAARPAPDKVAACEALYRAEGLGTIFRLSTARPEPGLEAALDARRYGPPRDLSLVLGADLGAARRGEPGVHLLEGPPDAGWLAASAALAGLDAPAAALRTRMLGGLAAPCAVSWIEEDGAVAAQALAAVHAGLVAFNAVATAPAHRGRGLATRALAALLAWAADRGGASGACLQVMADNAPALALYRGLGFRTELSRYHYRDAPPA